MIALQVLFCLLLIVFYAGKLHVLFSESREREAIAFRNSEREQAIQTIGGHLPPQDKPGWLEKIPDTATEICRPKAPDCSGLLDLASITGFDEIPYDRHMPPGNENATGYAIHKSKLDTPAFMGLKTHIIRITALHAEGEPIGNNF